MMKTLEDHAKLSFTHIMKHWKKGGTATPATKHPPVPGEKRTTLLRYYPPAHLKSKYDGIKKRALTKIVCSLKLCAH